MAPDEIPQELMKELSDSEKRLRSLYDRRDHFNEEAKVLREMRNDLHSKRKAIIGQLRELRGRKDKLLEEMKAAKQRRDSFNQRVRDLLGIKRKKDSEAKGTDPYEDRRTLEIELKKLEELYQTSAHSLEKEREIVKSIEEKRRKILALESKEDDHKAIVFEAKTKEDEITEYKRLADEEHARVMEIHEKLKEIHVKLDEHSPTLDHLRKEADKRHEESIKKKDQADSYHEKAMELREKVIGLRMERDKLRNDARDIIQDQNKKVKDELEDENKLDDAADRAVDMLLKKGKISL